MKYLKFTLFILFLLALSSFKSTGDKWKLYTEENGVRVYTKTSNCQLNMGFDEQRILIKIENTTSIDKLLDWDLWLWYNKTCRTCESSNGEYHRTLLLPANSSMEGECSVKTNFDLVLFVKFIDENYKGKKEELTKFELHNLTVVDN